MKVSTNGASRRDWLKRRTYEKAWREKNKASASAYKKKWYANNRMVVLDRVKRNTDSRWLKDPTEERRRQRLSHLKNAYGLSFEDEERLFIAQKGECAICKSWLSLSSDKRHIDHDPVSGAVRGLLCAPHNTGLGLFQHSPEVLRWAADYMERHRR